MDDFQGGLATITHVTDEKYYIGVKIKEKPSTTYNWTYLLELQDELKKRFGKTKAHPDPDDRPEFNMWD
jgi:hypothetical protein